MDLNALLDPALIVMLGFTIFRSTRLEKALSNLRLSQSDLNASMLIVDQSAEEANLALTKMNAMSVGLLNQVTAGIEVGQKLAEDLTYLNERAETTANRLEDAVRASRVLSA